MRPLTAAHWNHAYIAYLTYPRARSLSQCIPLKNANVIRAGNATMRGQAAPDGTVRMARFRWSLSSAGKDLKSFDLNS